ncbi:Arm DNA-binding domain-containing protein [Devosia sp. 1566]|uniref:tyrosine-type recombinase/integrase n=1 Tax=Devosia sp. 1566 TaxID=2499144 RepID=UPI0032B82A29
MARETKRLNARTVATITDPGMHADGDGLYLVVDKSGAKRWSPIYRRDSKRREMGLGRLADVGLADARAKAADYRREITAGIDPVAQREVERVKRAQVGVTFGTFASDLVADRETQFRNEKHRQQWRNTLATYCAPISNKRLEQIDTEAVLSVLKPIWGTNAETASRLRGRIERVLDAAKAKGLREGKPCTLARAPRQAPAQAAEADPWSPRGNVLR